MLSAWAVLAAPLAAAFVITEPSPDKPLVAGQNNTIAWDAESDTSTPPSFSIEVKTNGQWIPLGYEFADIPSDQGEINIQPLGSGYETAVRFVVDGEVLASTEDFFVQPPQPHQKRDEPELSAAVAPAATSVGESLLLAPTAAAGASGSGEGEGEGEGVPAPVAEEEEGESLLLAPSSTAVPSEAGSDSVTTRVANGPAGPAPTPGATIVANGTTLTLSEDTATVEVQDAGSTLLHQSPEPPSSSSPSTSFPASPANPANPANPPSDSDSKSSSHKSTGSPSSSGPLRLINDGESELAASGVITPGTLTAVTASAGPSLKLASGDEGSLILASGKATAGGMGAGAAGGGAGAPAVTADAGVAVASPSPSRKSGSGADAAGANQSSSAIAARPALALVVGAVLSAMAL